MSEKSSPADNNFISALQGLRFYFLLPVFFVHCKFLATLQDGGWYSETHINAGLSVCFFFCCPAFLPQSVTAMLFPRLPGIHIAPSSGSVT